MWKNIKVFQAQIIRCEWNAWQHDESSEPVSNKPVLQPGKVFGDDADMDIDNDDMTMMMAMMMVMVVKMTTVIMIV